MKKIISNILILISIATIAQTFISCESNDDLRNDWKDPYVYLQRENYLELPTKFSLKHTPNGISGSVEETFYIVTTQPANNDIKVKLEIRSDKVDLENIKISTQEFIIKAGELKSEPIVASIPELSFMEHNKEVANYSFKIILSEIEYSDNNVAISDLYKTLNIEVVKAAHVAFENGVPGGAKIANREDWNIILGEGATGDPNSIIDSSTWGPNYGTWVSHPTGDLEIILDFKQVHKVTGLALNHRPSQVPNKIEMFVSNDGISWESIGIYVKVAATIENIRFLKSVETRYFKYKVLESDRMVSITNFEVYKAD